MAVSMCIHLQNFIVLKITYNTILDLLHKFDQSCLFGWLLYSDYI